MSIRHSVAKHEREQRRAHRRERKAQRKAERRDERQPAPKPIRLEDVYGADEEPEEEP